MYGRILLSSNISKLEEELPTLSKPRMVMPGFMMYRFEPDDELLNFTEKTVPNCTHVEAESLVAYSQVDDAKHGKTIEVFPVSPNKKVVLPKSLDSGHTVIVWAGKWPTFEGLDKYGNLLGIIPEGCALKVEFVGQHGSKPHVKLYKAI